VLASGFTFLGNVRKDKQKGPDSRQALNSTVFFGGDEGDRTLDLRIANATLSQLSYVPTARARL
jgi:hypothetical protein